MTTGVLKNDKLKKAVTRFIYLALNLTSNVLWLISKEDCACITPVLWGEHIWETASIYFKPVKSDKCVNSMKYTKRADTRKLLQNVHLSQYLNRILVSLYSKASRSYCTTTITNNSHLKVLELYGIDWVLVLIKLSGAPLWASTWWQVGRKNSVNKKKPPEESGSGWGGHLLQQMRLWEVLKSNLHFPDHISSSKIIVHHVHWTVPRFSIFICLLSFLCLMQ